MAKEKEKIVEETKIMKLDFDMIINGALANILAVLILGILGIVFLDKKRVLNPWLYKVFDRKITKYLLYFLTKMIKIIIHPFLRIALSIIFLFLINYSGGNVFYSFLVFLILLSFVWKPKYGDKFLPVSVTSDDFKNLDKWETKTGSPEIESDFGKPAPDLGLKKVTNQSTNSFVILKDTEAERGIIECDIYLEENSLLNIVFFADMEEDNWFMARYDSRGNYSDGFLIKDGGPGANWRNFIMSGTQTPIKKWHRGRVEFGSTRVAMYKDGILIAEFNNPRIFGKKIGLFNEVGYVHVDNFSFFEEVV